MPRLLVVNADDLGASEGVNEGVARAHTQGILTSASLMVNRPAAASAAALCTQLPALSVGLHFEAPPDRDLDDPQTLAAALADQLARFRDLTGSDPTHLDSHHHVHLETPERLLTFRVAATPLGIPVRGGGDVNPIPGFYGQWEWGVTDLSHISLDYLMQLLREEVLEGPNELGCHPASRIDDLRSPYATERLVELETLTSPGLRDDLTRLGIALLSYAGWRNLAG